MTDPLDDLNAAMRAATPAVDAAKKREILARAEENFAAHQGMPAQSRPRSETPGLAGWLRQGAQTMLNTVSFRGGMVATTALVAVGILAFTPILKSPELPGDLLSKPEVASPAPSTVLLETEATETFLAEPVIEAPVIFEEVDMSFERIPLSAKRSASSGQISMDNVQASGAAASTPQLQLADTIQPVEADTEAYANAASNPIKVVAEEPVSTFSIDVDTASYSIVRSWLNRGQLPAPEAVRVEELINYFPYAYPAPEGDAPFRPTVSVVETPWNADTRLVHVALQGKTPAVAERPPLNLVFLIDTSGSMQNPSKLPLLKTAFRMMLGQLRPEDEVSIVTYAGSAGQVLKPTKVADRDTILAALEKLEAGGSTAGQEGLQQAYQVAEAMSEEGEINRVILATDGDFNVGISDPEALTDFISKKRESGTYLSVLGFGRGNLNDAVMQALAQNGNGQASYIDTASEARKSLVDQLTGALFPIAEDVKIQVEFNPAVVAEYRLIGYETRALRREDFNDDKVDAGEIGAGHSVTALYEVTPVGSPARLTDPLRYSVSEDATSSELGFLRLRYKAPGESKSQLLEMPVSPEVSGASEDAQFAIAVAGFGQALRENPRLGDWGISEAIALANSAKGEDPFGYRQEAIQLMRIAESLTR